MKCVVSLQYAELYEFARPYSSMHRIATGHRCRRLAELGSVQPDRFGVRVQ